MHSVFLAPSGQGKFNALAHELFESEPVAYDPFGNDCILSFDMAVFEVFQRQYVCFAKKLTQDFGGEPECYTKVLTGYKDIPVHITYNRSETVLELQVMTDWEPRANSLQEIIKPG